MSAISKTLGTYITCAVVIAIVVIYQYALYIPEYFKYPLGYTGDGLFTMAVAKMFADNSVILGTQTSLLNFPFGSELDAWYPIPEKILFYIYALLIKVFGLYQASNLVLVLTHVLSGIGFIYAARLLSISNFLSMIGGIAFGLTPFIFARGLAHLTVGAVWMVPACAAMIYLLSFDEIKDSKKLLINGLLIGIISAGLSPYYSIMFSQFLVFLIAYRFIRKERNLTLIPIAILIAIILAVLVFNIRYIENIIKYGSESIRSLASMEIYALKLPELFLPAGYHKIPGITGISQKIYYIPSFVKGELWSPYMGLFGISCCALFAVSTYITFVKKIKANLSFFWQAAWITAYSTLGGLNLLFGVIGFQMIRATNRYSIWLVAIFLLYALIYFDAKEFTTKNRKKIFIASVAILVAMFIYLDLPYRYTKVGRSEIVNKVIEDKKLLNVLKNNHINNLVVFPLSVFPENGPINKMQDYDFFRIYLNSNNININYGAVKTDKKNSNVNSIIFEQNLINNNLALASGYTGILINRFGAQEKKPTNLNEKKKIYESDDYTLYKLENSIESNKLKIIYLSGWSTMESGWIWSTSKNAKLLLYCNNNCRKSSSGILKLSIRSYSINRNLTIKLNESLIYDDKLTENKQFFTIDLKGQKNDINLVEFMSDKKPIRAPLGDSRKLSFALEYE